MAPHVNVNLDPASISGRDKRDRLPDFSYAGYAASTRPLPLPAQPTVVLQAVRDTRVDRTKDIQDAIDGLPEQGGSVAFAPGIFTLRGNAPIKVKSGVILQGAINAGAFTTFQIEGPARTVFSLGREDVTKPVIKGRQPLMDDYVPVGATVVHVDKPQAFKVGQLVSVERLASAEFIQRNGMHKLERPPGTPQVWMKPGSRLQEIRTVTAVNGKAISLDMPLTDCIAPDLKQSGSLAPYAWPSERCSEIGMANISFVCTPTQCGLPIRGHPLYSPIVINSWTHDSWLRSLSFRGFLQSIEVQDQARQITIQDCIIQRDAPSDRSAGMAADISIAGTQVLVLRCMVQAEKGMESIAVVVQARCAGPNAAVGCKAPNGCIQTHARWSSGFLIDGCDASVIETGNRKIMGSGHGWTTTNSIAWNSVAQKLVCTSPQTGRNYAIGCQARVVNDGKNKEDPPGEIRSMGTHVNPLGLFAHQLSRRIDLRLAELVLNMSLQSLGGNSPPFVDSSTRPR